MLQSLGKLFRSLKEEIQQFLASPDWQAAPAEMKTAADNQIATLEKSGQAATALQTGAQAPDFQLEGYDGQVVRLSSLTARGPVVLTFFRGQWCPFCNLQLKTYQRIVDSFKEQGAVLVAVSPQTNEHNRSMNVGAAPDFVLLSDPGNAVASTYGLTYRITEELRLAYASLGLQLSAFNGDASDTLPMAATYVVDTNGQIAYHFVSANHTERAEPADILATLKGLNAQKQLI
jgi:peroxiredoxin